MKNFLVPLVGVSSQGDVFIEDTAIFEAEISVVEMGS